MIFTNRHDLPEEVYTALSKDRYDKGSEHSDYSVTTLKTPPRIVQLQRRHKERITEDVIDNLWSMFGNMAHSLLEEHGSDEAVTEKRFYFKVLDRIISGQVDHYKDGIITDYKVTSAWTLVYGTRIKEWEEQLNMYAYLCAKNDCPVNHIRIVTILRDWDKHKAAQNQDYPQAPIKIIPITLWYPDEQLSFIEQCVHAQKQNERLIDDNLWPCSSEDMWEQASKFAVYKNDNKKATRVFDTLDEAEEFGATISVNGKDKDRVEVRTGKRTRCEDYCSVNCFCSQYKEYSESKEI